MRGYRKLIGFGAGFISLCVFLILGKLDGSNFIAGLSIIFGAFVGGNIGEHYADH